jgi:hypothetical protein
MRPAAPVFIAVLVSAAALAGCAGGPLADDDGGRARGADAGLDAMGRAIIPRDWHEIAATGGSGHDHQDPVAHQNLSTPNFELRGYEPLETDWHGKTTGDYFCGDTREKDDRRLSVVHSFGSDVAFVLADTTDPTKPKKLGELVMGNTQVYDVTLTPGLDFVLLATSPMDSGPDTGGLAYGQAVWRDACTGQERPVAGPEAGLPFASGIVLVDITNPRNPAVVDFRMFPVLGGHSVRAQELDGKELILVSTPNANYHSSYYVLMDIQRPADQPVLNILSAYQYIPEDGQFPPGGGMHDGYLQVHPVTGQHLAYLAYGGSGLVIIDVTDPMRP